MVNGAEKGFKSCQQGNMMMIILYSTVMAVVLVSLLAVTASFRNSLKESGREYANYQTYESVTEIACYAYVRDLLGTTAYISVADEWLSIMSTARYSEALNEMVKSVTVAKSGTLARDWQYNDIEMIMTGAEIGNPSVVADVKELLRHGLFNIEVIPELTMDFDWDNDETSITQVDGHVALNPFKVQVIMNARNEQLNKTYWVDGIFLDMTRGIDMSMSFSMGESYDHDSLYIYNSWDEEYIEDVNEEESEEDDVA